MLNHTNSVPISSFEKYSNESRILVVILTLGVLANLIALIGLIALIKLNKTQSMTMNLLTAALITTDLIGLIAVLLPSVVSYEKKKWLGGAGVCKYQSVVTTCCIFSTGCLATVMASDRLTAIRNPFFYQKHFTHKQSKVSIAYVWILSLIISVLPLLGFGRIMRTNLYCTVNWFATNILDRVYLFFYAIFGIMLVGVVVSSNLRIAFTGYTKEQHLHTDSITYRQSIISRQRSLPNNVARRRASSVKEMKKQLAKIAIAISVIFPVCWLPFMIRILTNQAGIWKSDLADIVAWELLLISLVLNPFLYTLTRSQCRESLQLVLFSLISKLCPCFRRAIAEQRNKRKDSSFKLNIKETRAMPTLPNAKNASAEVNASIVLNDFITPSTNLDDDVTDSSSANESPVFASNRTMKESKEIAENDEINPVLLHRADSCNFTTGVYQI